MSQVVIPPKLLGEAVLQTFDFTSCMATPETISTKSVTCTVYQGTDASPSSVISGAATNSGQVVTQKLAGGTLGVMYELLCTITTSLGQTLQMSAYLVISPDLI